MGVKFIAEVSSNHGADLDRAIEFIRVSANIGCDAVKFQLFKIDQLFAPEILEKSWEHRRRKEWELPEEYIPELATYAHDLGLEFGCTPFYLDAVDILEPHVDFFKIASYELLWTDLLEKCTRTGKPVMLSTGMATEEEIQSAYSICAKEGVADLTIFHCNSSYPTPLNEVNLQVIDRLRRVFNQSNPQPKIGWSDHSRNPAVIQRAVHHYNVDTVEFHLDLDTKGEEYSAGHCWLPVEMELVIQQIKMAEKADGSGLVEYSNAEAPEREWRADPLDGLRPFTKLRTHFKGDE